MNKKTSGIIDVVTDLGCDPTAAQDSYPAIQESIRGLTGPARYNFPPGNFVISRPIIASQWSPEFHGAGMSLTTISPVGGWSFPVFVFGIREIDGDNQVTAANRPDAFGKLDSSWVSGPDTKTGFRTLGTTCGIAYHHPLSLGGQSPQGDGLWTYHSEDAGWTFETALTFDGGFPSEMTLFGMGSVPEANPAPWLLGTTSDGHLRFFFRTNDDATHYCEILPPATTPTSVLRLRIWIDFAAGTIGAAIDGQNAPLLGGWGTTTVDLAGKRFWRNKGVHPFIIGSDAYRRPTPDFTVWSLRVSNIAIKTEPANDLGRYGKDTVNNTTVTYMPGEGPPGRDLRMDWAMPYPYHSPSYIMLIATAASYGLGGGGVFDMTINYGSPAILIGQMLSPFHLERLTCRGGLVGIGSLPPFGPSYTLVLTDVTVEGTDCNMSFFKTIINADRLVCTSGGLNHFRFQGGSADIRNSLVSGFHPRAETALEFYGSDWGESVFIDNLLVDNEGTTYSDAIIRIAQGSYVGPAMVDLRRVAVGMTAPVPIVILTGHATKPDDPGLWQDGMFYMTQFSIWTNTYSAALDVGDGWLGTIDIRTLANQKVTGVGSGKIEVVGATPVTPVQPVGETEKRLDAIEKWLVAITPFPANPEPTDAEHTSP